MFLHIKEIYMIVEMNSFSSSLMFSTTLFRNQSGVANKVTAQVGYALIAAVAAVESAVALAFTALSMIFSWCLPCCFPLSYQHSTTWLGSSALSLGWSLANFCLNPCIRALVADERSVRHMIQNGDIMMLPPGAILFVYQRNA
jgi:hypothetical protein